MGELAEDFFANVAKGIEENPFAQFAGGLAEEFGEENPITGKKSVMLLGGGTKLAASATGRAKFVQQASERARFNVLVRDFEKQYGAKAATDLKGLLGKAVQITGAGLLISFVLEEADQVISRTIEQQINVGDWDGAQRSLALYTSFLDSLVVRGAGLLPGFSEYFNAARKRAENYKEQISTQTAPFKPATPEQEFEKGKARALGFEEGQTQAEAEKPLSETFEIFDINDPETLRQFRERFGIAPGDEKRFAFENPDQARAFVASRQLRRQREEEAEKRGQAEFKRRIEEGIDVKTGEKVRTELTPQDIPPGSTSKLSPADISSTLSDEDIRKAEQTAKKNLLIAKRRRS